MWTCHWHSYSFIAVFLSRFDRLFFFFFKQKTAYEMRISDWSSDVCSSDLVSQARADRQPDRLAARLLRDAQMAVGVRRSHRAVAAVLHRREIGRASCRERVCQYV